MKSCIFTLLAFIFAILAAYHLFILNRPTRAFFLGAMSYAFISENKRLDSNNSDE